MQIQKIQSLLDSNSAALIISEENLRYFTGFHTSNGYLLITKNLSLFFTDSRYVEAAQKSITTCDQVCLIESVTKTLVPLMQNLGINKLFIEQSRFTLSLFETYQKLFENVEFIHDNTLDKAINELRRVKNEAAINNIIKAQRISEKAFEHILKYITVGKTEKEIALELDYFMLKNGADGLSFETIAVSGVNSSMPHGVPSDKKIEAGDFITMDFGAIIDGYHSDMTRTVAVKSASSKMIEVYETVLKAQTTAMTSIKENINCKDIDKVARDIITQAGFGQYFGHSLGHGVGIEIHEHPSFSPSSSEITEIGNVITVEPGIYIPDEFGVRIEDMIVVKKDGYENLTLAPKDLIIL